MEQWPEKWKPDKNGSAATKPESSI
jgi:hypothetical protein